jgi:hypothetical protein
MHARDVEQTFFRFVHGQISGFSGDGKDIGRHGRQIGFRGCESDGN